MGKQASAVIGVHRETVWRNRLARYATSKLTVEAFCRREAVAVGTFYGWQARLRARDADTTRARRKTHAPSPFLDLGPVIGAATRAAAPSRDHATHHADVGIDVRLELGGGVVLHIVRS